LSTGIDIAHPDFQGRASYGPNFIFDGQANSDDCIGSGTEEAGVIGGAQ
jgi:subtilisin family serine protease